MRSAKIRDKVTINEGDNNKQEQHGDDDDDEPNSGEGNRNDEKEYDDGDFAEVAEEDDDDDDAQVQLDRCLHKARAVQKMSMRMTEQQHFNGHSSYAAARD